MGVSAVGDCSAEGPRTDHSIDIQYWEQRMVARAATAARDRGAQEQGSPGVAL